MMNHHEINPYIRPNTLYAEILGLLKQEVLADVAKEGEGDKDDERTLLSAAIGTLWPISLDFGIKFVEDRKSLLDVKCRKAGCFKIKRQFSSQDSRLEYRCRAIIEEAVIERYIKENEEMYSGVMPCRLFHHRSFFQRKTLFCLDVVDYDEIESIHYAISDAMKELEELLCGKYGGEAMDPMFR